MAGGIIGAGFATGKELQLFFWNPDGRSLCLLAMSLLLMALISVLFFSGQKNGSQRKLVHRITTPCFWLFSAASYLVMLACGGEVLRESFSLSTFLGNSITWLITLFIVSFGVEGVYRFNLVATPILMAIMIFIGCTGLWKSAGLFGEYRKPLFDMLTYTGYNLLSMLPFLVAIQEEAPKKEGIRGIFLGYFLVAVVGLLLKALLNTYHSAVVTEALPLLKIIDMIQPKLSYLYMAMLYLSVLTTGVNGLYAITRGKHALFISLLLYLFSFFGFTTLINCLYPLFGYMGIGIVALILWDQLTSKTS